MPRFSDAMDGMQMEIIRKTAFCVIGKEGSTSGGDGFIARLWEDANAHFGEIAHLAKKNADGSLCGIWGLMTDFSRSFLPWEQDFSQGLYLAGVECADDAQPGEGWTKWTEPGGTYLKAENGGDVFRKTHAYMAENGLQLAGAVHDYTDPQTGKSYMLFPISRD